MQDCCDGDLRYMIHYTLRELMQDVWGSILDG